MLAFDLVPHRTADDDVVAVPTPFAMPREAASLFEVVHDALHRSLGDTHLVGQITETEVGIAGQADEHMAVVREERPRTTGDRARHRVGSSGSGGHPMILGMFLPELNFR